MVMELDCSLKQCLVWLRSAVADWKAGGQQEQENLKHIVSEGWGDAAEPPDEINPRCALPLCPSCIWTHFQR